MQNSIEEQQLQRKVAKILLQAAVFTGLLMGTIFLLQYEVDDERPLATVAIFTFTMSFFFTLLVWVLNIYIINFRIVPFLTHWVNKKFAFLLRGCISLVITAFLMRIWAELDTFFNMEFEGQPSIIGLMQVRGLVIVAISLTLTWGIEQALAQQQAMNEISKLQEENFQAKFEALKQQINPHFLFNSLNILKGMIRTQNLKAEDFVVKLADVYRYILQSHTRDLVTVEEELAVLEAYFFMIKNRFRDAIDLNIQLSEATRRSSIPPLTFQILVENCVKHNVLTHNRPLYVTIAEENNCIVVQNNLQVKNAMESSNQLGLLNITQRYNHVNGKKIVVEKTPQYFTIKLPILK
jgi:two-component system, LytTR family, sensor kinase